MSARAPLSAILPTAALALAVTLAGCGTIARPPRHSAKTIDICNTTVCSIGFPRAKPPVCHREHGDYHRP